MIRKQTNNKNIQNNNKSEPRRHNNHNNNHNNNNKNGLKEDGRAPSPSVAAARSRGEIDQQDLGCNTLRRSDLCVTPRTKTGSEWTGQGKGGEEVEEIGREREIEREMNGGREVSEITSFSFPFPSS